MSHTPTGQEDKNMNSNRRELTMEELDTLLAPSYQNKTIASTFKALKYYPYLLF